MFDFAAQPGQLFVVATLLPLASFVLLLLVGGLRLAVRPYREEHGASAALFRALGGDTPAKWPAYVATGAIGLAFVCSAAGAAMFVAEQPLQAVHEREHKIHDLDHQRGNRNLPREERDRMRRDIAELRAEVHEIETKWSAHIDWARVGPPPKEGESPAPATVLRLGFRIDNLSVVMFVMVTLVATLIHVFSIGYMSEELQPTVEDHQVHAEDGHLRRRGRFGRFFLYLSLFCFSMLNLVLADNLFQVFLSWELVGICSYLLIGFYYERDSASTAANKAFITNRVGDAGFILGLLILWTYVGTFNFEEIFARVRCVEHHAHGQSSLADQFVRAERVAPKPDEPEAAAAPGNAPVRLRVLKPDEPVSLNTQVVLMPSDTSGHFHSPGHDAARDEESEVEARRTPAADEFGLMPYWMLVAAGLGIFLGCVGKSAQFPLQVWLPDAMEGPTPVSALIHAATMVAAGVYLVARVYPLFTPEALLVIAYTGAVTLFVAATIAIVMTDVKKVLAYSTVSQLGFMMLALGVGGWVAGEFHLITHAFFKALLFLGSGSVIYGCHHEQDMSKMGGLYPKMKITALTMLMGVLAISGTPIFSGWYSKDAVLASSLGYVWVHKEHVLLFVLPLVTAGITTFYMFRMWFWTFTGAPRDSHVHEHAHESPALMTGPLVVLAFFSVTAGWGWPFFSTHFPFINAEASWLERQIHHAQPASVRTDFGAPPLKSADDPVAHETGVPARPPELQERAYVAAFHETAGNLALLSAGLGFVFACSLYWARFKVFDPAEVKEQFPWLHRFLSHKWYFDELYSAALVRPSVVVGRWFAAFDRRAIDGAVDGASRFTVLASKWNGLFDLGVIDGLVNLTARVIYGVGGWLRGVQTGYLRSYVLFLALAAVGIFVVLSYFVAMATAG